jgi:hypothetical protein
MTLVDRVSSLKAKHATLENQIDRERQRPSPDGAVIQSMKREKLRLKEEIERLAH